MRRTLLSSVPGRHEKFGRMRSRSSPIERVILDLSYHPPDTVSVKYKPPNKLYIFISTENNNSPGLGCWLVCTAWAILICLNTYTWHVGAHNLTMNNYAGVVQHVLHHNSPNNITFRSPFSNTLFPSTICLLLGSRSPLHQSL